MEKSCYMKEKSLRPRSNVPAGTPEPVEKAFGVLESYIDRFEELV